MIQFISYTALAVAISGLIVTVVIAIKNEVTGKNYNIIARAIYKYHIHCLNQGTYEFHGNAVEYCDMADYDTTLYRIWDWGYTRILPPEKYEIIKPFIEKGGETDD